MSEQRAPRPEFFAAFLSTVTWAAVSFALIGSLSWGLDREPVAQPVGPGFAFAALGGAGLLVWLVSAYSAWAARPWLSMLAVVVGTYLVITVVAFIVSLSLLFEQLASPFVIIACLVSAGAVLLTRLLARVGPGLKG